MPRHNFSSVRPHVIEFCQKHNIEYVIKPLLQACGDIIRWIYTQSVTTGNIDIFYIVCSSLKESGEIWLEAWNIHMDPESKTK